MSYYKDTLFKNNSRIGDQIQLFISNEGIMRVFFNDAESNIYTIVNKNSNYRHIIDGSFKKKEEGKKFYEYGKETFNTATYGGISEPITDPTLVNGELFRTPYKIYKYENGKALTFNFQERYYVRPEIPTPIYNVKGYNEDNILPNLNSYTDFLFQNFNSFRERFWKQYYDGIVYFDEQDDGFNTNKDIFLRELTIGSIDTYDIVNSDFDLTNTQSSSPSPIIVAPNKRLILCDQKSKYMKTARPPKIYLDSNNRTSNQQEYYKGIFVIYPYLQNIYLVRLNEIGTLNNPSGETKKVTLNELFGLQNLNVNKFHCDITLDILQNDEENEFNGIWSTPYFIYSSPESVPNTNGFLVFGYAPYNLSESTLDSEIKQVGFTAITAKKCKILTYHNLSDEKTWENTQVLISYIEKKSNNNIHLKIGKISKTSIDNNRPNDLIEKSVQIYIANQNIDIKDYDIIMDDQNNIYICYSSMSKISGNYSVVYRKLSIDFQTLYIEKDMTGGIALLREYFDYFNTISIALDLDQNLHIVFKMYNTRNKEYELKYITTSDKVPKKIEKDDENDFFKLQAYGQTLNKPYPEVKIKYNLFTAIQPVYSEARIFPWINTNKIVQQEFDSYLLDKIYVEFEFIVTRIPNDELVFFSVGNNVNTFVVKIVKDINQNNRIFVNDIDLFYDIKTNVRYLFKIFYDKTNKYLNFKIFEFSEQNYYNTGLVDIDLEDITIDIGNGYFYIGFSPRDEDENFYFLNNYTQPELSNGHIYNIIIYNSDIGVIPRSRIIQRASDGTSITLFLRTALKDIIHTGENKVLLEEKYKYRIDDIINFVPGSQTRDFKFTEKAVFIHKLWFLQKNIIGFEELEDEKIELLSMDYFLDDNGEVEQIWAVGKVTDTTNNTYGKIYYSNDFGETWLENTTHSLYPISSNLNTFNNKSHYTYVKTFIDELGAKWVWVGGNDYIITYTNNYVESDTNSDSIISDDIDKLGKIWHILGDKNPDSDIIENYTPGGVFFDRNYGDDQKLKRNPFILGLNLNISYIYPIKIDKTKKYSENMFGSAPKVDDFHLWIGTNSNYPVEFDFTKKMGGGIFELNQYQFNGFVDDYIKYIVIAGSMVYKIGTTFYESQLSDFIIVKYGDIISGEYKFGPQLSINTGVTIDRPEYFFSFRFYRSKEAEDIINQEGNISPDNLLGQTTTDFNDWKSLLIETTTNNFTDLEIDIWTPNISVGINTFINNSLLLYPKYDNTIDHFLGTYDMVLRGNEKSFRVRKDDNILLYKKDVIKGRLTNDDSKKLKLTSITFKGLNNCLITSDGVVFFSINGGQSFVNILNYKDVENDLYFDRVVRGSNIIKNTDNSYNYRILSNTGPWNGNNFSLTVANFDGIYTNITPATLFSSERLANTTYSQTFTTFRDPTNAPRFVRIIDIQDDSCTISSFKIAIDGGELFDLLPNEIGNVANSNRLGWSGSNSIEKNNVDDMPVRVFDISDYILASDSEPGQIDVTFEVTIGSNGTPNPFYIQFNNNQSINKISEGTFAGDPLPNDVNDWYAPTSGVLIGLPNNTTNVENFIISDVNENWINETNEEDTIAFWEPVKNPEIFGEIIDTDNLILTDEMITDNKLKVFDEHEIIFYSDTFRNQKTLFYYKSNDKDWHRVEISDVTNLNTFFNNFTSVLLIKKQENPIIISYVKSNNFDIRGFYFIRQTPPTPTLQDPSILANRLYPFEDNYSVRLNTQINDADWYSYLKQTNQYGLVDFEFIYFENKNNEGFVELEFISPNNKNSSEYKRFFLEPGTKYEYKVKVRSAIYGESNESKIVTIITLNEQALIDNFRVSSKYIGNILKWNVKLSESLEIDRKQQLVYFYDLYRQNSSINGPFINILKEALYKINGTLKVGFELTSDVDQFILEGNYNNIFYWETSDNNFLESTYYQTVGFNKTYVIKKTDIGKWIRLRFKREFGPDPSQDKEFVSVSRGLIVDVDDELNELLNPQGIVTGPDVTEVEYYDLDVELNTLYTYYLYPKNKLTNRNTFGKMMWTASTFMSDGIPKSFKLVYNILDNSLLLTWFDKNRIFDDEDDLKYTVKYRIKQLLNNVENIIDDIEDKQYKVSSLLIDGSYSFQIMSIFTDYDGNIKESKYSNKIVFNHNFDKIENIVVNYNLENDLITISWKEPENPLKPKRYLIYFEHETYPNYDKLIPDITGNSYETDGYSIYPGNYKINIIPFYKFRLIQDEFRDVGEESFISVPYHPIKNLQYSFNNNKVTLSWNKVTGNQMTVRYKIIKTPVNNGEQCDCPTNSWVFYVCQPNYDDEIVFWTDETEILKPSRYSYDVSVEYDFTDELGCNIIVNEPINCNSGSEAEPEPEQKSEPKDEVNFDFDMEVDPDFFR